MDLMLEIRRKILNRQSLMITGLYLGVFGVIWVGTRWIAAGDYHDVILASAAPVWVLIVVKSLRNWRVAFYLFLFMLLFEDLMRKFSGNSSAGLLWAARQRWLERRRTLRAIRRSLIMVLLALSATLNFFPQAVGARWAFYSETLLPSSAHYEVSERAWNYPVGELLKTWSSRYWETGQGIGTASLGAQYVSRVVGKRAPAFGVESGHGTLIIELGILGPLLWLSWTVSLVYAGWRVVRRLRGNPIFPLALSILYYAFLLLFPLSYGGIQPYQNYIMNAYLWLLVGVLFRLPALAAHKPASSGRNEVR